MRNDERRAEVELVNEEKTQASVPDPDESTSTFWDTPLGRCYSRHDGQVAYIGTRPSRKRVLSQGLPGRSASNQPPVAAERRARKEWKQAEPCFIGRLGQLFLHSGPVSKAYRAVDSHTDVMRLRRWLREEAQTTESGYGTLPG